MSRRFRSETSFRRKALFLVEFEAFNAGSGFLGEEPASSGARGGLVIDHYFELVLFKAPVLFMGGTLYLLE